MIGGLNWHAVVMLMGASLVVVGLRPGCEDRKPALERLRTKEAAMAMDTDEVRAARVRAMQVCTIAWRLDDGDLMAFSRVLTPDEIAAIKDVPFDACQGERREQEP
jgi:hypothetical protein